MTIVARLFAVTIDCPDPLRLARFYQGFLGGQVLSSNSDFAVLTSEHDVRLDFQRVTNHRPPSATADAAGVPADTDSDS